MCIHVNFGVFDIYISTEPVCRQRQFVDELRFLFGFILKSLFIIILRFSVRIIVVLIVCIFVIRILIIEKYEKFAFR